LSLSSATPASNADQEIDVWVAPYLPEDLRQALDLPPGFQVVDTPQEGGLRLEVGDDHALTRWVYALVAPFPTIPDGVDGEDLMRAWRGESQSPFAGQPILLEEHTLGALTAWWGEPASSSIQVLPKSELLDDAWDRRPSWVIIPFEELEPRWKVLEIDGQSPLRKEFDLTAYPLAVPISLTGESQLVDTILASNQVEGTANLGLPVSNRDPERLTVVDLTGVTALVRATAFTMRRQGITYPARDIGDILRQADILHISNEIPFAADCPAPNPTQNGLVFCSDPEYIGLLEEIGTDIVELTGDHFGDWGPEAMRFTLGMYDERGWPYYGGGYDREAARQARLIEHNGNRLAFIGCNAKGGGYATASENQPGAVACDYDWMHAEIARLAQDGYQVIATFQHFEYYVYAARPDQVRDFQGMARAGAAIVSGSQAHQPQGIAFSRDAFIHYGLGNLFFDQWHFCTDNACDDAFIDRHVFYNGRYIGTELITIVFEDYARPRLMTAEERESFLNKIFTASDWN
jgi:poly-gamma-glutamate synthesis protein (capsule biosynthesis protein)